MRKGISDTAARIEISKNVISRFVEHMSAVEEKERLGKVVATVASPITNQGKKIARLIYLGRTGNCSARFPIRLSMFGLLQTRHCRKP